MKQRASLELFAGRRRRFISEKTFFFGPKDIISSQGFRFTHLEEAGYNMLQYSLQKYSSLMQKYSKE